MYRCEHFGIKELVSPIVYSRWGEQAWMFFDEARLRELDQIREWYGPLVINNWAQGGSLSQCGLRCNLDPIVTQKNKAGTLYLSAHCLGAGFDLHCIYGHHEKLWSLLFDKIAREELHTFHRLENRKAAPTWVHVDGFQSEHIVF